MENEKEQTQETSVPEPVVEQTQEEVVTPVAETQVEEEVESERERNLKAEARRKQEKIKELEERLERLSNNQPENEYQSIQRSLNKMNDRELEAYLNNPQYSNLHPTIREIMDERRYDRYHARKEENRMRLDAEIELETKFPDVLNPSHPMALKTKELMRLHRLEGHPQGRLIAARLASVELQTKKAAAAGRKAEQNRQADVKANFAGETSRPAPAKSGSDKLVELKKQIDNETNEARRQELVLQYNFESMKRKGVI